VRFRQFFRQPAKKRVTIFRPLPTGLHFHNDFPTDQPVSNDHVVVDRADGITAGLVKDCGHPPKKLFRTVP